MSTMRSHGLLGVSIQTMRVAGVHAARDRVEVGEVDGVDGEPGRGVHLEGEADGAAVGVVGQQHVVAGARAGAAARPRRPGPTRTRSRGRRPRARRGGSPARCGWGCRCGRTRSRGACRPPPARKVVASEIGGTTAPVDGSGRTGAVHRLGAEALARRGRPSARPPVDERAEHVGAGDDADGVAAVEHERGRRGLEALDGERRPAPRCRRWGAAGPSRRRRACRARRGRPPTPGAARARTPRRSPRPAPPAARASRPASGSPRTRAGSRWPCARSRRGGCARARGATGRGPRSRSPTVGPAARRNPWSAIHPSS